MNEPNIERAGVRSSSHPALHITQAAILALVISLLSSPAISHGDDTVSLVVKFKAGLSLSEQAAIVSRNGGVESSSIQALRLHVITVSALDLSVIQNDYQADPQVESVEINKTRKAEGVSSDPSVGVQWALAKIGWQSVFGSLTPAGSAKVALLDTGVDATHPDLAGNLVPGTSLLDGSTGLTDPNGHGTWMAGIVGAVTDNRIGVAGVAYSGVKIVPVTVLNESGVGQDGDIIAGIVWAADHGADVILMPFSNSDFSQHLQDAIDYAWTKGAVLVSATGNSGVNTPTFPAGDRGVIGVSETAEDDTLVAESNLGQDVFLAAPGSNIFTTGPGGAYSYVTGTSAASAVVAGVAAFMKAVDPSLSNGVIVGRLAHSADAIGTAGDPNNQAMFGNGRVNMAKALLDTGTAFVQPAGASPVGAGGPYVGPYTAAALGISGVSPNSGSVLGGTTVTITGTGFTSGQNPFTVTFGGIAATNVSRVGNSNTQLTATTPAHAAGSVSVTVTDKGGSQATLASGFTYQKIDQTITFGALAAKNYGDADFVLSASASSNLTVSFATSGPCSISGSSLHITGIGTCTVTASQPGDSIYNAAPTVPQSFLVSARLLIPQITANNKPYDGTTAASLGSKKLTGVIDTDAISLSVASATFDSKNVGTSKVVTATGLTISGANVSNYTLSTTTVTATANITPLAISVSVTAANKVYDATAAATITSCTLAGAVSGDKVSCAGSTAAFADKNVGSGKTVTATGLALSGTDAANYTLSTATVSATADITPLAVTGSITAANKVYDATTATTITGRTLNGVISGDSVSYLGGSATFADKNVGSAKTVTATGLSLSGTDVANYSLSTATVTTTADITPLAITGSISAANKVYDATTAATITSRTLAGVINGDNVSYVGGTVTFADKNVGSDKTVTATGLSLSGTDRGNYLANTSAEAKADISPAPLKVTATGQNKTYDGTATATVTLSDDHLSGDSLSTAFTSATFADRNVGTAKPISVTGISTSGSDAANYTLASTTAATTADITARTLIVTAQGQDKVYDGTTSATVILSDNRVPADILSVAFASATFADRNVGTGKTISVIGISISGTDAGNYTLGSSLASTSAASSLAAIASITPRPLTVAADAKSKVYGAADPLLTYQVTGGALLGGDSLAGALTRAAGESTGTYAIGQGALSAGSNYSLSYVGADLTITPAATKTTVNGPFTATYGQGSVALSATVSNTQTAATVNEGTVTFLVKSATATVGTITSGPVSSGNATVNFLVTAAGNYTVEATYNPGADFRSGSSLSSTLLVNKATTAVALAESMSQSTLGQQVTFTVTVTGPGSSPTGKITFSDGSTVLGSAQLNSSGSASLTSAGIAVGTHSITAAYEGDANFLAGNSAAAVSLSVNYGLGGLLPPYATPASKAFKVKSAIPIKWQFTDVSGKVVNSSAASPLVTIKGPYACGGNDDNLDPIVLDDAGNSGYQYDTLSNTWQFNWKTTRLTGGCYSIYIGNGQTKTTYNNEYPISLVQ